MLRDLFRDPDSQKKLLPQNLKTSHPFNNRRQSPRQFMLVDASTTAITIDLKKTRFYISGSINYIAHVINVYTSKWVLGFNSIRLFMFIILLYKAVYIYQLLVILPPDICLATENI